MIIFQILRITNYPSAHDKLIRSKVKLTNQYVNYLTKDNIHPTEYNDVSRYEQF